jgi:hypothetical protein
MKLVRSALTVSAVALVSLMPAAAHADTVGHTDPSGDVRSVQVDGSGNVPDTTSTAEASKTLGDVTRVVVSHRSSSIRVLMRFRSLSRAGFVQVHEFQFVTPTRSRIVYVVARPGQWGGTASMRRMDGRQVACSLTRKIDYVHHTVLVVVPRSCLGRPSRVKVGSATIIGYGSKYYYDDARRAGGEWTDPFVLSPWIHR